MKKKLLISLLSFSSWLCPMQDPESLRPLLNKLQARIAQLKREHSACVARCEQLQKEMTLYQPPDPLDPYIEKCFKKCTLLPVSSPECAFAQYIRNNSTKEASGQARSLAATLLCALKSP
jgi:hypothetical protein